VKGGEKTGENVQGKRGIGPQNARITGRKNKKVKQTHRGWKNKRGGGPARWPTAQ